ncbi:MAG: ImmA/IrrE family metallo-endopeptidase [Ignavibacteriales bacterium]|nr:MAG: ImmA/IrrE family metallo-endopeptidase [Ignavibacteriales bacterium]
MIRWTNTSYQKIRHAKFANENVVVIFENGDIIEVPIETLIPFDVRNIEWNKLHYNPFEIIIPASPHSLEIPWDKLRVMTDKDFAKYLANKSEEQAKLIGVKIKRLRERNNLSSKNLAERAGVSAQTISRIEKGHTDVSFGTLRKILAAMGFSLKDLANQEIELEMEKTQKSFNVLLKRLSYAGIDSNFLTRKIIPARIQFALNAQPQSEPAMLLDEAASYVSTIYGWTLNEIWGKENLVLGPEPAEMAFFKKPTNANENQVKAYSHYAFYLAKVVLKAFNQKNSIEYPYSIEEFKNEYFKNYQNIDLIALLEFVWNMGICVLPLSDSGVFHGASWNIEGRHVVVLKQNTQSHARWIFDLLHELYHVFMHLDKVNTSVVEVQEMNPFSNNESMEELEANSFANQVIFGGRAEVLTEKCVTLAKYDIKNLAKAVSHIAKRERVREDFLSNYLAFRLSYQGENWWSTANKMQVTEPNPFTVASDFLKEKIQIQKLTPMDFSLLNSALAN